MLENRMAHIEIMPALADAQTPRWTRLLARVVLVALAALPFGLLLIPWQQTVHAQGRAIAFDPVERPQFVVSPIEGRVNKWYVREGDHVEPGDLLVAMIDNDPLLIERLQDEEQAIQSQVTFAVARVQEVTTRITNIDLARTLQVGQQEDFVFSEERTIEAIEQEIFAAEARLLRAKITFERVERQFKHLDPMGKPAPLVSEQEYDNARQEFTIAEKLKSATEKRLLANKSRLDGARKRVKEIDRVALAQLNADRANLNQALEAEQSYRRTLLVQQSRIARQRQQTVYASTAGTVFRILQNGDAGGQLVRPGERLAVLVPDIRDPEGRKREVVRRISSTLGLLGATQTLPSAGFAGISSAIASPEVADSLTRGDYPGIVCELLLDGNDLPLVAAGDRVRLQFEGWAAVQFVAFPEAATGTFGGRVYLVDPTANERGQFRVLVEPDPAEAAWPDGHLLRQGVRAQGWVLLKRVPLGQELWRQLNGFPPAREVKAKDGATVLGPVQKK